MQTIIKNPKKRRKQKPAYRKRDEILRSMGFDSYSEYRRSWIWQQARNKAMQHHEHRCYNCGDDATEVHHLKYDEATLCGVDLKWLMPLCRQCHQHAEVDERGKKRSLDAANQVLMGYHGKGAWLSRSKAANKQVDSQAKKNWAREQKRRKDAERRTRWQEEKYNERRLLVEAERRLAAKEKRSTQKIPKSMKISEMKKMREDIEKRIRSARL